MVSLLLIFIIAISASAVCASEDMDDADLETSDISSDIELNEEETNTELICEDLDDEDEIIDEINTDSDKLGDGVTQQNTIPIKKLSEFTTYVGTGKTYGDGTIFDLGDNSFNLTNPQDLKISCTIVGGTLKAENLDYFFRVNSPAAGGPSSITIKNSKFIITKSQSVVLANGQIQGINQVLNIAGITLENITFEVTQEVLSYDIDLNNVSLLYVNATYNNNPFSNVIDIHGNDLDGANTIYIPHCLQEKSDVFYDATEILERKHTSLFSPNAIFLAVDKASGDLGDYFEVLLYDENNNALANKTLTIGFNGNTYSRTTDENGIARMQINIARATTYTFGITFLGDDYYYGSFTANSIKVVKKYSLLTIKNLTYKVNAAKKLSATFKDEFGKLIKNKKVTFTVNGKTYSATTNSKGVASVKITLNKKGTYTYTAKYAGDNIYEAVKKNAKLKILPLGTSLTTKKVTYKKAANTKKISVTLKSGTKALKSKKVTIKVNKKTYTAKTNSKGVATVKVSLNKKGTYTYTAKFAGDNTYKAISKSNKILIK